MGNLVGELVLRASSAMTASGTGATTSAATLNRPSGGPTGNIGLQRGALFRLACTTSAGTNPRLFVKVVGQFNAGDTLQELPGLTFAAVTSTAVQWIPYYGVLPPNLFSSATVNGTSTPSFTWELRAFALG